MPVKTQDPPTSPRNSESRILSTLAGLDNLGNTCYMNSALQCLFGTTEMTKYFLDRQHLKDINTSNPAGNKGKVAAAYGELMSNMIETGINGKGKESLEIKSFGKVVEKCSNMFEIDEQQDSSEFLNYLVNSLHEDLNRVVNKPKTIMDDDNDEDDKNSSNSNSKVFRAKKARQHWDEEKLREDSIITDLFQGQYMSRLTCKRCKYNSAKFETFKCLSLPVPSMNERRLTVRYLPTDWKFKPTVMDLAVNLQWTVDKLLEAIARIKQVENHKHLMLCDIKNGSIENIHSMDESVSDIDFRSTLVVYELKQDYVELLKSEKLGYRIHQIIFKRREHKDANKASDDSREKGSNTNIPLVSIIPVDKPLSAGLYYIQIMRWMQCNSGASLSDYIKEIAKYLSTGQSKQEKDSSPTIKRIGQVILRRASSPNNTSNSLAALLSSLGLDGDSSNITTTELRDHLCRDIVVGGTDTLDCLYDADQLTQFFPDWSREFPFHLNNYSHFEMKRSEKSGDTFQVGPVPDQEWHRLSKTLSRAKGQSDNNNSSSSSSSSNEDSDSGSDSDDGSSNEPEATLDDCFDGFTSKEYIEGWTCDKCKSPQDAYKQISLTKLPQNLIIHFNRFEYHGLDPVMKNRIRVDFPLCELDLTHLVAGNKNGGVFGKSKQIYDLYAVCNHYGKLSSGHYTAYVKKSIKRRGGTDSDAKSREDVEKWYEFDDESAVPIADPEETIPTSAAYVLFYRLRKYL